MKKIARALRRHIRCFWESREIWLESVHARRADEMRKCVFFISTPTHGNLGDHAIVLAQYRLFEQLGAGESIVEITRAQYERYRSFLQRVIKPEDVIVIDGGGNIGTMWPEEENKMRDIITRFPDNPIFIFPQTAFFSSDSEGKASLNESVRIYSNHRWLTVFCRDLPTYRLFQEQFSSVRSFYTPDMVPFLSIENPSQKRKGVLLCFRKDLERQTDSDAEKRLTAFLIGKGLPVHETSTLVPRKVTKDTRMQELQKKWNEFSESRLVITDRLHGMIFCAITGTPCVALDNISHKVQYGYQWIKMLPYIHYCTDESRLMETVVEALNTASDGEYKRDLLLPSYQIIMDEVKKTL